ncbi:hypothetical protein PBAL39_03744 [Pedobacter sp. BAL39]|nr:hypothetical protein PBAL39_03744 [Pedobacter sp. BAL39]
MPRYLTDQEQQYPLTVLNVFFEECEIEQFRLDLRFWFALSSGDQQYREMKQFEPSGMVDLHQQITRLLEAAYLMQSDEDGGEDLPRTMFAFLTLSEWQDELDILLYYSLNDTPVAADCDNHHLYFPMYELLDELLDWAEEIHEDELQQQVADELPEGIVIFNRNDDYFPPELILVLYEYGKAQEGSQTTVGLSPELHTKVLSYLHDFPPLATVNGLKKIYLNYMKFLLKHGDFHKDDDGSFVSHMDRLFELLQAAGQELRYPN